jgi:parallel beta-helix repeat protein
MGYWGQIDSAGFNLVVGQVDSTSTRNPYGIKYIGQSGELKATNSQGVQYDLGEIVGFGYDAHFEAEEISYDSTKGYWFEFTTGNNVIDDSAFGRGARLAHAGADSAGYLITGFSGLKTNVYNSVWSLQIHFRLKVADNSSSDTVCLLEAYGNTGSGWFLESSRYVSANDFQASSTYEDFSLLVPYVAKWQQLDYRVYWYGGYDLWVDRVHMYNYLGEAAFNFDPDSVEAGFSRYNQWINSDNHYRFYPADEPKAIKFELHRWFDDYSTSVPPGHPGNAVIQNYSGYPWLYAAEVQRPELFLDYYPFFGDVDSASEGANSVQFALSAFITAMTPYASATKVNGKDFWMLVQGGAVRDTAGNYILRNPQATEIRAQVWLALAHSAKGIGYFLYAGFHLGNEWYEGLVEWNDTTERYEPTYRWYAVKDIHTGIDTLASALLSLGWQGAGVCYDASSIPGSFIESVQSAEFDSAWIEAGFFKDSVNTDYFMLVNRRCLSSEEQNVTAYIDSSAMNTNRKMWYVIDQYSQDTTFTGAIDGTIPFTTHLEPGEGKLFKLMPFPDSAFHGTAHPFTWQGGIMVDGDVTVDSGQILNILSPAKITFYANTDVVKTWDTTDCDLAVNGGLRAIGTETDSIVFTSTEGNPEDWEGIRTLDFASSNVFLSHCVVENTYTGIDLKDPYPDTVVHCRFSNNRMYGIYWQNDGEGLVSNNTVLYDTLCHMESFGVRLFRIRNGTSSSPVTGNLISNYRRGLYVDDCSTKVSSNTVSGSGGFAVSVGEQWLTSYPSHVILDNISVEGELGDYGFYVYWNSGRVDLQNCTLAPDAGHGPLYGAVFENDLVDSIYFMRDCEIKDFTVYGVMSNWTNTILDLGTEDNKGFNKIHSNVDTAWYVYMNTGKAKGSSAVYAQYNWWGEYPPDSSRFFGNVYFMPALEFEPEQPGSSQQKLPVSEEAPIRFELVQNYPNPFNPTTSIYFSVAADGAPVYTTLRIYNILGQLVRTLTDEEKGEGRYIIHWDGRNDAGNEVSSGVYFYKLEAGTFSETKKMVLLR